MTIDRLEETTRKVEEALDDLPWKVEEALDDLPWKVEEALDDLPWKVEEALDDLPWKVEEALDDLPWKVEEALDDLPWKVEEGHRRSDEHWDPFKSYVGVTFEKPAGPRWLFRVRRHHLELNWRHVLITTRISGQ